MAQGIIRLEDMPSVIPESEVPTEIIVPNPGDRKVVILTKNSGVKDEQVFTSDCLPDEISYKFLGLIRCPDGTYYPKYVANEVTSQTLKLKGKKGAKNGIESINKVAKDLTYQPGILTAKSVKRSDLQFFDYREDKLSYWLASPGISMGAVGSYYRLGPGAVNRGSDGVWVDMSFSVGDSNVHLLGVRPVMVLSSKIQMDRLPLIKL